LWHANIRGNDYYESSEYRQEIEGTIDIHDFHKRHDCETLEKFSYTGTSIFRNKVVLDVGAGGGSWIDFLCGVAKKTIAIEPTTAFRDELVKRGHVAYSYARDAQKDYRGSVDVITSFDVIEHVSDPIEFADDIFSLLSPGGSIIIGTPSDHAHLRELLGDEFNQFIFSVQHPWVFGECSLQLIFSKVGFSNINVKTFTKYGLGNVFAWLKERKPCGQATYPCISDTADAVWKSSLAERGEGDYLVLYAKKEG
jgi:SAM-dependent methyltransferase